MASVFGTAFANFAPNVTGISEIQQLASTTSSITEDEILKKVAGPVFNIVNYGAVAGATDSRAAIQSAIDACASAGGGVVFIPKGSYRISSPGIVISSPYTWLVGQGQEVSILRPMTSFVAGNLVTFSTASFCGISNLSINCVGILTNGLYIYQCARFVGRDLQFGAVASGGIAMNLEGTASNLASHAGQYSNIKIILNANVGTGIRCGLYTYDCQWLNIWIAYGVNGIALTDGAMAWTNVHVWQSNLACVDIVGGQQNRFNNCYFESSVTSFGVRLANAPRNIFENCYIWKNHISGIYVFNSPDTKIVNSLIVDNNVSGGVNQGGVRLDGTSTYCIIMGNRFGRGSANIESKNHVIVTSGSTNPIIIGNVMKSADASINTIDISNNLITVPRTIQGNSFASRSYVNHNSDGSLTLSSTTNTIKLDPTSLGQDYTLSFPVTLPSQTQPLSIDNIGNLLWTTAFEKIIASSNTTFATTSTTDAYLTQVMIPANAIGPNGFVTVQMSWERSNGDNTVSCGLLASSNSSASVTGTSILFNGTSPYGQTISTSGTVNRSFSTNSFIIYGNGTDNSSIVVRYSSTAAGVSSSTFFTVTIDTSQNWYLKFIGSTTNAATTCSLRNYCIKTLYSP